MRFVAATKGFISYDDSALPTMARRMFCSLRPGTFVARAAGYVVIATLPWALAYSQQVTQPPSPKTKLEAFEAQEGVVVVRGFSKIGEMQDPYGGLVSVESMEFTNAATGKRDYGIKIEIKEGMRLQRTDSSFVDYDEIESLIKGIDYITKIDKTATKLDNVQADYWTRGDLGVGTFSSSKEMKCSISSGRIGQVMTIFKIGDLSRFRGFIESAKEKIDSAKAP